MLRIKSNIKKKENILFASSLQYSNYNKHIFDAIYTSLREHFNVDVFSPFELERIDVTKDYSLLIYLGSMASVSAPIESIGLFAKNYDIPSVFWSTEDPYEFDYRYRTNDFTIYCSNDYNSYKYYPERNNVFFLPLAAPSSDYRDMVDFKDRTKAMLFCGYPYAIRKLVVKDLLSLSTFNKQNLIVSGTDWNDEQVIAVPSPVDHAQMIDYYCSTLFSLNIGRDYDISNLQCRLVAVSPGPRTFEAAICGSPQLYFSNSFFIDNYFEPDKEIIKVSSVDEISDKFYFYLNHLDLLREITYRAQKKVLREHTYANRIKSLINICVEVGIIDK